MKAFQQHVPRMMGSEIVRKSMLMLLGTMSAEQRVAAFLVNLSDRAHEEIGGYLGMKLETVRRMFSKLHRGGLIDANGKQFRILDLDGLNRV